jgi:L-alanine-DL-glutamate epimerase-like enolase superfamily enzyme
VTFDVNRAWTPGVAVQVLNSVTARDWVEQPCETLDQCAHVAGRVRNPIMLDECMHTMQDHLEAWKLNACEGVKVKPNRVGGLTRGPADPRLRRVRWLADAHRGPGRLGTG